MDGMFFELLYITVTLYLKNLFFEKIANPNGVLDSKIIFNNFYSHTSEYNLVVFLVIIHKNFQHFS